jgi:hypothetical protein
MKIIICGPRDFNYYDHLLIEFYKIVKQLILDHIIVEEDLHTTIEIVSGGATGTDHLAELLAENYGIPLKVFPAQWEDLTTQPCLVRTNGLGKSYNVLAGKNRNREMAEYASQDKDSICVAVWRDTPGTNDMIEQAEKKGIRVFKI